MFESSACQSGFVSRKRGEGRGGGGGLEGEWEERDNKAGGDVNSQIGSFSCFPPPATLDGWLRQIPRASGRRSPRRAGHGGGGAVGARLGSVGRALPRLQGEERPRETGNSWGHRGRTAPTVYMSPLFAAAAPEVVRADVPSGYRRAKRLSTRGVRDARGEVGRGYGFEFSFFSSLHCSPEFALTPSRYHLYFGPHLPSCLFVSPPLFLSGAVPSSAGDTAAVMGLPGSDVSCGHSRDKPSASRFLSLPFRVLGELRVPLRPQT